MIEVIGEAGVNHNGDVNTALKMIDAAKWAGADIVKFQTYCPEEAINPNHSQFALLKSLALTHIDFVKLAKHCEQVGIEFLSTPGDLTSLKFLVEECGVKRIKIGSDDLTYKPIIEEASKTGLPIILSTGMATLTEIWDVVPLIRNRDSILLHCVSSYPCALRDVNLRAIPNMESEFGFRVGYSDHTNGIIACIAAAAMGAIMIEKHFELGGFKGVDTDVSVSQWGLSKMVTKIREVELMLGTGIKEPCEAEKLNIPLVRKREDGKKCA